MHKNKVKLVLKKRNNYKIMVMLISKKITYGMILYFKIKTLINKYFHFILMLNMELIDYL